MLTHREAGIERASAVRLILGVQFGLERPCGPTNICLNWSAVIEIR